MRVVFWAALGVSGAIFAENISECTYCLGPENYAGSAPVRLTTCKGNWTIMVAGFCWDAHEDGLEFTLKNDVPIPVINPIPTEIQQINQLGNTKYETPHSKWEFGAKLGLEYTSTCDYWDFGIILTNYKNRSRKLVDTEISTESLIALWSAFGPAQGSPLYARVIQAIWKVKLNLLDIPLGRESWTSKWMSLRPHIGLRYARVSQDLDLEHRGGSWSPRVNPNQDPFTNTVKLDNTFKGVGLRGGIDTGWHCGFGFQFYGNMAASIVYGRFQIEHNENNRLTVAPYSVAEVLSTKERFRASRAILDLALGVQWSRQFFDCTFGITTQFGWEQHLFFDQNQLWRVRRYSADQENLPNNSGQNIFSQTRGTLDIGGWTLSLTFEY